MEILISWIIGFIAICVLQSLNIAQILKKLSNAVFEVLLIQRFGLGSNAVNYPIWYIQSMLLVMLVLYPSNRKWPDFMKYIGMPLIALSLLGYLQQTQKTLRNPSLWMGFTYKGNIRAMAELCLGAETYYITQKFASIPLKKFARILLAVVKWMCWIGLLVYMWKGNTEYDFSMLVVLVVAVILAFSKQCIDTELYNNRFISLLGKFSLCLYLSHMPFALSLGKALPEGLRYRYMLLIYVVCSFVTALVVMCLSRLIRKKHVFKRLGQILIER